VSSKGGHSFQAVMLILFSFSGVFAFGASNGDNAAKLARLSLEVQRVEDLRAVKRVQIAFAQYLQFGLWSEAASLFAENAEANFGGQDLKGRAAIRTYFLQFCGGHVEGLPTGGLYTLLEDSPVLNLSADGQSAKGRWHEFVMAGRYGGSARWEQSITENQYRKEEGIWKITRVDTYLETAGPYETGWVNAGPDIKLVPFHYTPSEAGVPIPPIPEDFNKMPHTRSKGSTFAELSRRIQAMNDEDKVTNLQNAYGYYTDRKMWDDASDLFSSDAVLEQGDIGIYSGVQSIRRSFERMGPAGLQFGQMNNHLIFNVLVSIASDGSEARTRAITFNMLGDYKSGTASLGVDVMQNRFVKGTDGLWRIREMRVFPIMATDYYLGWAKSRLITPPVAVAYTPDRAIPPGDKGTLTDGAIPDFVFENPATRKLVAYGQNAKIVGRGRLLPAGAGKHPALDAPKDLLNGIADAERRLSLSVAYLAADNISHALGNYIDDQQWHSLGLLFAKDGWRAKFAVAFCVGPQHAEECERNYDGVATLPRVFATGHWLIQPVIDVARDGKSAKMRHRLLHIDAAPESRGFTDGVFPNNAAKLEDGVWKFDVAAPDQPYFTSPTYKDGWARKAAPENQVRRIPRNNSIEPLRNFPPDVPRSTMPIRYHGTLPGDVISWPEIKPMWFAYKNPVSGRTPPLYCADLKTCEKELEKKTSSSTH